MTDECKLAAVTLNDEQKTELVSVHKLLKFKGIRKL